MAKTTAVEMSNVSNDAKEAIEATIPYIAEFEVSGSAPLLFHKWSCEEVEAKATAAKGSKAKKTDNIEAYLYRTDDGLLAIPGEYFRMSLIGAAKFRQDPRSPRKSAMDLFKAGVASFDELCVVKSENGSTMREPQFIDRRRVVVQRNAITRSRPALFKGWNCKVQLQILLPEYITPQIVNEVFQYAGRIVGVGDFRPSFGRFNVTGFKVVELS